MSDVVKIAKKVTKIGAKVLGASFGALTGGPAGAVAGWKIGDEAGDAFLGATEKVGLLPKAKVQAPLGVPTVDQAAQNQQVADRVRLRRGVLANIYGGAQGGAPRVGTKTLLGG